MQSTESQDPRKNFQKNPNKNDENQADIREVKNEAEVRARSWRATP